MPVFRHSVQSHGQQALLVPDFVRGDGTYLGINTDISPSYLISTDLGNVNVRCE